MKDKIQKLYKSKLAKETFAYTLINVLNKTIPFILLPVYTRLLSKQGMGSYLLFQALYQVLLPILTLALQNSVLLNYYHLSKEEFNKYFSAVFYLFIGVFFFTGGLTFSLSHFIAVRADISPWIIQILVPIVFLSYICDLRQSLWRNERKPILYGKFTITYTFLQNAIGFVFVIFFKTGWEGIVYGTILGSVIMSIFSLFSFYKESLLHYNILYIKKYIRDAFVVSIPLSLHTVSAWLGTTVNRLIVANRMGVRYTASYGIGSTFFMICDVLFDALNKAYVPAINERLKDKTKESRGRLNEMTFYYYVMVITITLLFAFVGYFSVGIVFGQIYESTKQFIIPTTLAAGFNGLYKIHANEIFFTKKTWLIMLITVSSAIINIPLSITLITHYGLLGAAYSLLIINIYFYLMALIISKCMYRYILKTEVIS